MHQEMVPCQEYQDLRPSGQLQPIETSATSLVSSTTARPLQATLAKTPRAKATAEVSCRTSK